MKEKIQMLVKLGESIANFPINQPELVNKASILNPWFTAEAIAIAAASWGEALQQNNIEDWLKPYAIHTKNQTVGIIMAGNIPWVGLHDFICAWLTSAKVVCKLSSNDEVLMKWAIAELIAIGDLPNDNCIIVEERIGKLDKLIATGSNNSSRYFEYYFREIPKIIRKNRSSVAVVDEETTETNLEELGNDIFTYFGLGCRNVGKVFLPKGFDVTKLIDRLEGKKEAINHHKYSNNYTYHKAILLMNLDKHLDNGFMIFQEKETALKPPLSQLFYAFYEDKEKLVSELGKNQEIQCIVGNGFIPFGSSQNPGLQDYADNVDTIAFLLEE